MKTTIVCGLLGSGKTTFIRNFVKGLTGKVVALVNDFGAAGIDGEIFSTDGIESVELPSGCVCCTLKFDLITTIKRIAKTFAPKHLLIEPSGVASPSGVLEALESAGIGTASVVGLVDAVEFAELYESGMYGSFFEDQIANSDMVLVNKADLAGEAAIAAAERLIASVNPYAVLLRTVKADFNIPLPQAPQHRRIRPSDCHFNFEMVSFRISSTPAFSVIEEFFDELAKGRFGSVARAKALVNTPEGPYRFDITYGKIDKVRFEKDIDYSRLVVIGEALDRRAMASALPGTQEILSNNKNKCKLLPGVHNLPPSNAE
jgi:G3E family GTPase